MALLTPPKRTHPKPTCKSFVVFLVIIVIVVIYYFYFFLGISMPLQSFILSSIPQHHYCYLSMKESDGWFCENDSAWERRKAIHRAQDARNRISDTRYMFFQNNWEPTVQCGFERRVGNTGDGGKWICDLHRFEQMNNGSVLIYSFGSNGDFSFERATKELLPQAEIHTFDAGVYQCPDRVCTFHQALLGQDGGSSKSLETVMEELGHRGREIHVLKVDVEGSEFDLFEHMFQSSFVRRVNRPYIRQILFEIHLGAAGPGEAASRRTHELFELFRVNNYAIFHKEANLGEPQDLFEYALLRLNAAFFSAS